MVVLDEATAHLDSESEVAVQRALKTALAGRTSLVIAHRLSTIREADQILVIDEGQVRERGTHEELLAAGGLYAELYHTQFARQEPAEASRSTLSCRSRPGAVPGRPRLDLGGLGGLQQPAPGARLGQRRAARHGRLQRAHRRGQEAGDGGGRVGWLPDHSS